MLTPLSIDALLRIADLAATGRERPDLLMLLDNAGSPVAGESTRKHPDGKPRLDILGWSWGQLASAVGGSADGARHFAPLTVVRQADAASASLSSLAYSRTQKLAISISVFRAGGDASHADTGPMFEFGIEQAQLIGQHFMTGHPAGVLLEVLMFSYRKARVRSAPQQASGARGAVRECLMAVVGTS